MPYSIGLYFDQKTDSLVRDLWKSLAVKELASYYHQSGNRPHITMGVFNDINLSKAEKLLLQTSQSLKPISLSFQQIGIFPSPVGTVFWGPVVTKNLLDFQLNLYKRFYKFSVQSEMSFYKPDNWIPHIGLAMDIEDISVIPQIVKLCQTLPNPHLGTVIEIGLISFRPVKQLLNFPLT